MLPPTVKQFFFKLLISIFVHDYKNVLRQYRQAYTTQRQMKQAEFNLQMQQNSD